MASENTKRQEKQDKAAPKMTPPKPADSNNSAEVHSVRVDNAAAPRVAPPKAWKSGKPPGGKLPEKK